MSLRYSPLQAQTSWAAYLGTLNAMKQNNLLSPAAG